MRAGESLLDPQISDLQPLGVSPSPDHSYQEQQIESEAPVESDPNQYTHPQEVIATVGRIEDVCRICLEAESSDNQLIHPCKCTGTVKYIHEECLKAWLASQAEEMDKAECELCKTPFTMTIKLSRKCAPEDACHDGFTQCLFAPLLLAVLGMLILIVYLLSDKYLAKAESGEQRGYTAALIVTCLISAAVITYLLFRSLREACCSRKLTEWKIMDYEVSEPDQDRVVPETKMAIDIGTSPTRMDIKPLDVPLEEEKEAVPPIMVIPKRIKVHGVKVKTPQVRSTTLTPVNQRGRLVAVTPRMFAFPASLSQSRASLNVTPKNQYRGGFATPVVVPAFPRWTPEGTMERQRVGGMSESLFATGDRS